MHVKPGDSFSLHRQVQNASVKHASDMNREQFLVQSPSAKRATDMNREQFVVAKSKCKTCNWRELWTICLLQSSKWKTAGAKWNCKTRNWHEPWTICCALLGQRLHLFLTCVKPLSHTGCIEWIDPRCNIVSFHQFQSTILRWEWSKTHWAFDFECNWSWGRVDHFQVAHTAVGHQWHLKKKKKSVLWKETFMFARIPWQDGSPH